MYAALIDFMRAQTLCLCSADYHYRFVGLGVYRALSLYGVRVKRVHSSRLFYLARLPQFLVECVRLCAKVQKISFFCTINACIL